MVEVENQGKEAIIVSMGQHENDRPLLTRNREFHKDMESIDSGLDRPEIRNELPVLQLFNTFVVLVEREFAKRIIIVRFEIYINLKKYRKVSGKVYTGLWVLLTFRSTRSLARIERLAVLMPFS